MVSPLWNAFGTERVHLEDLTGTAGLTMVPPYIGSAGLGGTVYLGMAEQCGALQQKEVTQSDHCMKLTAAFKISAIPTENYVYVASAGEITMEKLYNSLMNDGGEGGAMVSLLGNSGIYNLDKLCASTDKTAVECQPKFSYAACLGASRTIDGTNIQVACGFEFTARIQLDILSFKWAAEVNVKITKSRFSVKAIMHPIDVTLPGLGQVLLITRATDADFDIEYANGQQVKNLRIASEMTASGGIKEAQSSDVLGTVSGSDKNGGRRSFWGSPTIHDCRGYEHRGHRRLPHNHRIAFDRRGRGQTG